VRKLLAVVLIPLMCIAGCGGGGGGGSSGGGGGGGSGTATAGPPNVESMVLDGGPSALTIPSVNTAFVSIKVCIHGTSTCQTIDHVEVDTGSVGLRIIAGGSSNAGGELTIALTPVTDSNSHPLAECLQFADGFSWGSVATADITMPVSMETASNVIVHIIGATSAGDPANASPTCVPFAPLVTENTVTSFGANGIIGVGPFLTDCVPGGSCAPGMPVCQGTQCVPQFSSTYYSCPTPTSCAQTTASATQQLQNPGSLFANDNNGVILELPSISSSGAASPPGALLVFGIGTQSNNGLGSATKVPADNQTGFISAMLNGSTLSDSYLDSGSNGNFFVSSSLPACGAPNTPNAGFYCPSATTSENATLGTGINLAADFDVANANTLFQSGNTTFNNLAGTISDPQSLDLGLPFFFGRNVYTGFYTSSQEPFFAY
jgi:Protein of unknown function (DUF3443)